MFQNHNILLWHIVKKIVCDQHVLELNDKQVSAVIFSL